MFRHDLIELPSLKRIDGEVRYYELPTGERYPSATSVISAMSDDSFLDAWRARIGYENAERITKTSSVRGSAVHDMCERFVLNRVIDYNTEMPFNVMMFKQLREQLITNVNDIRISEGMLYSHKLKVAGSVDLVASWKGKPAIIDFKTSIKDKKRSWIDGYFIQVTMYAMMLYEMTGIFCNDIVILMCVEQSNRPQVFVDKAVNWMTNVVNLCKQYHKI